MTNPNTAPTTTTPEAHPLAAPVNERQYTIDNLATLHQRVNELEREDGETDDGFSVRRERYVHDLAQSYVGASGIEQGSPRYSVATLGLERVLLTPETEWYAGPRIYKRDAQGNVLMDADGNPDYELGASGLDKIITFQQELFGRYISSEADASSEDEEAQPVDSQDIIDKRARLAEKRTLLATLTTKRQSRLFGKGGEKFATAKEEYNQLVCELAKHDLQGMLADDTVTPEQKNARVIDHLFTEQKTLREETLEQQKHSRVGKFVKWMTEGKLITRVIKGVAVGVGASVAGAAVGALAGAASLAAVGAGAAAVITGGARFARGFAYHAAHKNQGMPTHLSPDRRDEMKQELGTDINTHVDRAQAYLSQTHEDDTNAQQAKRRRSVGAGVVSIAVGAGLGLVAQGIADATLLHGAGDHFGTNGYGPEHHAPGSTAPAAPEHGHPAQTPPPGVQPRSDTPGTAQELRHALGGNGSGEFSPAAETITPGEGWDQTFVDLGITNPNAWSYLLHDNALMGQLQQMGLAYPDQHLGGWGIYMTPNHHMPDAALELIKNAANQSGYDLAA